eukprot:scpid96435/ scgid28225/ 
MDRNTQLTVSNYCIFFESYTDNYHRFFDNILIDLYTGIVLACGDGDVWIGQERNVVVWCIGFHNGRVVATSSQVHIVLRVRSMLHTTAPLVCIETIMVHVRLSFPCP